MTTFSDRKLLEVVQTFWSGAAARGGLTVASM